MGQQMLGQIGSNIHPSAIVHISRHIDFAHGRVDQWNAVRPVSTPRHVDDLHPLAREMIPFFGPVSCCDMWGVIHQVIAKFAPDQLFDKGLCICGALHHCLTGHMPHLTRTNFTQRQNCDRREVPLTPSNRALWHSDQRPFHELK